MSNSYAGRKNWLGLYHGLGTMTYADGSKYSGYWKNGTYHGGGTLTSPAAIKNTGTWEKMPFLRPIYPAVSEWRNVHWRGV